MNRTFPSESWEVIPRQAWREAREETHDLAQFDRKLEIIGTDIDDEILKVARRNLREADLEGKSIFKGWL